MAGCIYLADLDDTLFNSLSKQPEGAALTRVTTATNGHHSYMTGAQQALFSMLRDSGVLIPVTARSSEAFARVHLDFGTRRAVLANGAVILNEQGAADPKWQARSAAVGARFGAQMAQMCQFVAEHFGAAARSWVVEEYAAPVYLCAKVNKAVTEDIAQGIAQIRAALTQNFDLDAFLLHHNGNNLSLTPREISKHAACVHLLESIERDEATALIGVGDSVTDLAFMALCDFMMTPNVSQIAARMEPMKL